MVKNIAIPLIFLILGFLLSPFQRSLEECYFGMSGHTKIAEVIISVGSQPITLNHLGIEYLNLNSDLHEDGSYDLKLEYRIEDEKSKHDNNPIQEGITYGYNWSNTHYVIKVMNKLPSGNSAGIGIYIKD
ncbi:MAG: hypothetical protein RPS47_15625 [Colwellia sp.]